MGAISLGPITERNKGQPKKSGITFDAKQKIADKNYLNSILYSLLTFQIYEEKNRWEKYNFFSFWNITLDLKPKWVQPTWTLVSIAIAWTRRCTGTCFATICRFGIIAFSFPSLPTATTTLRTFTPRAPIAPVSINYKKKWTVETSSRPVSSSNNSYWTSTEYLTRISATLHFLWLCFDSFNRNFSPSQILQVLWHLKYLKEG